MLQTAGRRIAIAAALAVVGTSCGARAGGPGAAVVPDRAGEAECPTPIAGTPADTLRVGVVESLDPRHAPGPGNRAEAIGYRLLYPTLVRVECGGRPYPGLAEGWTVDESGRRWTFELRGDARFWDGSRVTAGDVRDSWLAYGGAARLARSAGLPPDSIRVRDARTLVLAFSEARPEALAILAHPSLAVVRPRAESAWPMGAGEYRVERRTGTLPREREPIRLRRLRPPPEHLPGLIELHVTEEDGRDLIDRGVDLLIATDPDTREYAASRDRYTATPLPWDRVHVLIVPGALAAMSPRSTVRGAAATGLPERFREAVSRDAVPADQRSARERGWWTALEACRSGVSAAPQPAGARATARVRPAVVYRRGDPIGRAIAERLVAVAATAAHGGSDATIAGTMNRLFPTGMPDRAVAESEEELGMSLASGTARAFVLSVPTRPLWPCEDGAWLLDRPAYSIVETRAYAIFREGSIAFRVDADGTPVIGAVPAGARP